MHLVVADARVVRLADDRVGVAFHGLFHAAVRHGIPISGDRHRELGRVDRQRAGRRRHKVLARDVLAVGRARDGDAGVLEVPPVAAHGRALRRHMVQHRQHVAALEARHGVGGLRDVAAGPLDRRNVVAVLQRAVELQREVVHRDAQLHLARVHERHGDAGRWNRARRVGRGRSHVLGSRGDLLDDIARVERQSQGLRSVRRAIGGHVLEREGEDLARRAVGHAGRHGMGLEKRLVELLAVRERHREIKRVVAVLRLRALHGLRDRHGRGLAPVREDRRVKGLVRVEVLAAGLHQRRDGVGAGAEVRRAVVVDVGVARIAGDGVQVERVVRSLRDRRGLVLVDDSIRDCFGIRVRHSTILVVFLVLSTTGRVIIPPRTVTCLARWCIGL